MMLEVLRVLQKIKFNYYNVVGVGTKLQLRARINPDSAWKYVKLMEVTVSPDPDDPHMSGSVALVKDG